MNFSLKNFVHKINHEMNLEMAETFAADYALSSLKSAEITKDKLINKLCKLYEAGARFDFDIALDEACTIFG